MTELRGKFPSFETRGITVVLFVEHWDWIERRGFMRVGFDAINISHAYDPYAFAVAWCVKQSTKTHKVKMRDRNPFGVETSEHSHVMDGEKFRALVKRVNGAIAK